MSKQKLLSSDIKSSKKELTLARLGLRAGVEVAPHKIREIRKSIARALTERNKK